jgi:hypothetical protein
MGRRAAFGMANLPMCGAPSRKGARLGFWWICLSLVGAAATVGAGNLNDLLEQKGITPEALARAVADFTFELAPLQNPDTFLQRKRGDCADFANLASLVLTHRGYTTKLVVVMMSKQTHVVCYVKEAGGFLDYNHRADTHPVIASDGSLEDIAGKVAGDFRSQWRMVSVFRYREKSPIYLDCVFATDSSTVRSGAGRAVEHRAVKATRGTPLARTAGPAEASAAPVVAQAMIN